MFSKRDYWPFFVGALVLGGGLALPYVLHLMAIPHQRDYDGSLLIGLMLCAPFLFAIDRQDCSIGIGKLIIAYVLMNYLAIRIMMQGGDVSMFLFPSLGALVIFYFAGWVGVKVGHLVGYSQPPEKVVRSDTSSSYRKVYVGSAVVVAVLVVAWLFLGGNEPALDSDERLALIANMERFPANTMEKIDIPGGELTMMIIPGGQFEMGSIDGEETERPVHAVVIHPFRLSKYEITVAQWKACWDEGFCKDLSQKDLDRGGTYPASNVSYEAATQQFIPWLNSRLNAAYRLPSEAEWEYAARAGSTTKYSWGDDINPDLASYYSSDVRRRLVVRPVNSYEANSFGLHNMHGNVSEWVQDCWHSSYKTTFDQAPQDGSAWMGFACSLYVSRGGGAGSGKEYIRSAYRYGYNAREASAHGFRLAHDI